MWPRFSESSACPTGRQPCGRWKVADRRAGRLRRTSRRRVILEGRGVSGRSRNVEPEAVVVDEDPFGDELLSGLFMAGNHAANGLRTGVVPPDADAHPVLDTKPPAPRRVLELDRHRVHTEQFAGLPRPGEVLDRRPTEAAEEDVLQCAALSRVAAGIDVEPETPRRPRLVVAVAAGQDRGETREIDVSDATGLDHPREHSKTDSVCRAPPGDAVDAPARTDHLAVACLEVRPADAVGHGLDSARRHFIRICRPCGWVRPGTLAGAAATQIPSTTSTTASTSASRSPAKVVFSA